MRSESEEERGHAMQFIDFANKRNYSLKLEELATPPSNWGTAEELWGALLQGEKDNTESLKTLADAAAANREHALSALLDPFHMEQIESEDSLRTILAKVRDQKQTPGLLRQLDSELDPSKVPTA
jgi:ferritin